MHTGFFLEGGAEPGRREEFSSELEDLEEAGEGGSLTNLARQHSAGHSGPQMHSVTVTTPDN